MSFDIPMMKRTTSNQADERETKRNKLSLTEEIQIRFGHLIQDESKFSIVPQSIPHIMPHIIPSSIPETDDVVKCQRVWARALDDEAEAIKLKPVSNKSCRTCGKKKILHKKHVTHRDDPDDPDYKYKCTYCAKKIKYLYICYSCVNRTYKCS